MFDWFTLGGGFDICVEKAGKSVVVVGCELLAVVVGVCCYGSWG